MKSQNVPAPTTHLLCLIQTNRHNENRARLRETTQSNSSQGNEPSSLTSKDSVRRQHDIMRRARLWQQTALESNSDLGRAPRTPWQASASSYKVRTTAAIFRSSLRTASGTQHTAPLCACTCHSVDLTSSGPVWPTSQAQVRSRPEMLRSPGQEYIISVLNVILGHCLFQRPVNNGISLGRGKNVERGCFCCP